MAGFSLLTLLDDIATVLDDVAVMSKMAAKKTAGVLGDDLALNAEQVTGVRAEREIPVVWQVAKGSFRNKLILVPAALIVSAIAPWLVNPVLLIGGLYLCFEGAEKVLEKFFHKHEVKEQVVDTQEKTPEEIAEYEKQKIKGAIRTDFILSLEIIVIVLGLVTEESQITQILVVSLMALLMTVCVYGLVAGIVKLDDLGFYCQHKSEGKGLLNLLGNALVASTPKLMKLLAIVGTIAMFLVGGGIIEHTIPFMHHLIASMTGLTANVAVLNFIMPHVVVGIFGLIAGLILVAVWEAGHKVFKRDHA